MVGRGAAQVGREQEDDRETQAFGALLGEELDCSRFNADLGAVDQLVGDVRGGEASGYGAEVGVRGENGDLVGGAVGVEPSGAPSVATTSLFCAYVLTCLARNHRLAATSLELRLGTSCGGR